MLPLIGLLSGCGSDEPKTEAPVSIAWISKGQCNTFFDISRFGVRLAENELTKAASRPVKVQMMEPDDCSDEPDTSAAGEVSAECEPAAPQIAVIRTAMADNFQAIAISVANPTCVSPVLDEAVDAGIKVITFDSDAPDSQRHTYYGMDNEAAGRLAVRTLAQQIGESGEIAIQTSMTEDPDGNLQLSTSSSYVGRMAGITEELAKYPDISLVATVPCRGNEVDDSSCAQELEAQLETYPNLKGFILARGKALRELELASAAPELAARVDAGTIHNVAFDAPDDALEAVLAGYADMVIAQKQFDWGYGVVKLAYDMVTEGVNPPDFSDSGWYAVCANNVEQYATMWEENDFRGEFETCELLDE